VTDLSVEEELLADLRMTRQVLEERGHTRCYLINPNNGSVCLTGAAAIAVEGVKFIDHVQTTRDNGSGSLFDWSPRTVRLLEALAEFSPAYRGHGRSALAKFVNRIIRGNDGPTNYDAALMWVDKAISKAEKAVAEEGRMSVEEEL